MDHHAILRELESLGTEQNRKVYRRHGVGENQYGVSYASLYALQKKIRCDQAVARGLWASGNHDARVLATLVADPTQMTGRDLDAWARDLDNYVIADAFSKLAARSSQAQARLKQWTKAKGEWVGRAGWLVLANLAGAGHDLPDGYFEPYLEVITRDIHTRQNYVRAAMNSALIAIGLRSRALQRQALRAASIIGRVEVDHGLTNCKTPDATAYIKKAAARRKA